MFSVRMLEEQDYPEMCRWWNLWRFPCPAKDCLPQDGLGGIMVSKDGVNICAGFLYFTNSKLVWMEFIVSNPDFKDRKARKEALQFLIKELSVISKNAGFKYIFTSVKNQNLINHFKEFGFSSSGNNTTEMVLAV